MDFSVENEFPKIFSAIYEPSISFTLVFVFIFTLFFQFYFKTRFSWNARCVNGFPGGPIIPFVGNAFSLFGTPKGAQKRITEYFRRYGKTVRLWRLDQARIFTKDPQIIKTVLTSSNFIEKGDDYYCINIFLGDGLITSKAKQWKMDKKFIKPGFAYKQFEGFMQSFNKSADTFMEILNQTVKNNTKPLNLLPLFAGLTLEILARSTLGCSMEIQREPDKPYVKALFTITDGIKVLIFKPWLSIPIIRSIFGYHLAEQKAMKVMNHLNFKIVEDRRMFLAQRSSKTDMQDTEDDKETPLIDYMIDSHISQNINLLSDHVLTFIGAGSDTSSKALNFTLFMLAINPDCQDKVHQEIDSIFKNDFNRRVTLCDIEELKYLKMCTKEALRILPPVPLFSRKSQSDFKLEDGRILPKGCDVVMSVFDVHRDPDVYPNPEEFIPERFSTKACTGRSQYAYLPFSAGPRECLGSKFATKELQVSLIYILRKYKVKTEQRFEDLQYIHGIPASVDPEIQLSLHLR